ncbi:ubiquinol-cytochrome C reductase [Phialemonium atrogriseum]|uniref:Complex III subunit 9 n=1 Tax=Phialemonium atrogriseum TaxID=1093897 RepID=A0AAJ0FNS2_9PEZI|nr:ubiquinol-cytochrome C reductase [Phialemonium atrogriseum]KAK1769558.1 ubiquinol-cytochrome C reductase [Phialemonium atrogriseum]
MSEQDHPSFPLKLPTLCQTSRATSDFPQPRHSSLARQFSNWLSTGSLSSGYINLDTMSATTTIYNGLFRRNWTMLGVVFASAFVFELGYNTTMNKVWDNINRGRQWKDIRSKYVTNDDEEE